MEQRRIKQLLHAASFADCSRHQRLEILAELLTDIPIDKLRRDKSGERDREVVTKVYWEIARGNPQEFLQAGVLRLFALLCGERNGHGFAHIDGSIFETR